MPRKHKSTEPKKPKLAAISFPNALAILITIRPDLKSINAKAVLTLVTKLDLIATKEVLQTSEHQPEAGSELPSADASMHPVTKRKFFKRGCSADAGFKFYVALERIAHYHAVAFDPSIAIMATALYTIVYATYFGTRLRLSSTPGVPDVPDIDRRVDIYIALDRSLESGLTRLILQYGWYIPLDLTETKRRWRGDNVFGQQIIMGLSDTDRTIALLTATCSSRPIFLDDVAKELTLTYPDEPRDGLMKYASSHNPGQVDRSAGRNVGNNVIQNLKHLLRQFDI